MQAKKGPDQQWFPTQYRLTEERMSHIMVVNWDDERKIPPVETGPLEKQQQKIHKVDEDEEEGEDQDRGKRP